MKNKRELILNQEFKEILKNAYEISKTNDYLEVSSDSIVYCIFQTYLEGKGSISEFRDYLLSKIYSEEMKINLLNELKELYISNSSSQTIISRYRNTDNNIVLSKETSAILKAANIVLVTFIKTRTELSVVDFLSAGINTPEFYKIASILGKYGMKSTDFFELCMGKDFLYDTERINNGINDIFSDLFSDNENNLRSESTTKWDSPYSSSPSNNDKFNEDDFEKAGENEAVSSKKVDPESKTPFLDQFSFDMTKAAKEGKYDPVVGRDKEISQIVEILCCRKKNNAVLLGDPGCGKTAVVECLVQKIINKEVPDELINKRICSLDLNALVSGTKYRGEYEQRLQEIIKEVCTNPDIIVYIDEFHNLVGNGGSSGNGDGANILKPYLARGEFQCIGSTTVEEYRKFIEKDGALKRRFQNVQIEEPTSEETFEILKKISRNYSLFHKVVYTDEVIRACVDWSGRYVTDRFFPDKAIDCLDMAGSLAKLSRKTFIESQKIKELNAQLEEITSEKIDSVKNMDFEKGKILQNKEKTILKRIEKLTETLKNKEDDEENWNLVTLKNVAEVISKISGVPVDKISETDIEKLKKMKASLESKVIGQGEAVGDVVLSLQRNHLGLRDENKPIATMLFVGPTGTGKSLICKEIAKEFFGSEKSLIRFDMGEFSEHHEVTKLTGATASYVGYDESPLLEQIRRNPYSVVLFDEIEKAAPEIYNIFLNILDEGYVTLGNGVKVDFRNTIIIFTGNIGTKELMLKGDGLGFGKLVGESKKKDDYDTVMKSVKKQFKPEFINRLTNITVFNELSKDNMNSIFDIELNKLKERLSKKGYNLSVSDNMKDKVISECDTKYGARDLQRNITKWIENEICNTMLKCKSLTGVENIIVDFNKDSVKVLLKKKPKEIKVLKEETVDNSTTEDTIVVEEEVK